MSRSWAGWLAFLVLAATVGVVSCQAWRGPAAAAAPVSVPVEITPAPAISGAVR